jgi:hypothetical protein
MQPTIGYRLYHILPKWVTVLFVFIIAHVSISAQTSSWGIRTGFNTFDSFNNFGVGPMVGLYKNRHEVSLGLLWMQYTTIGGNLQYRFDMPLKQQRTVAFLQVTLPVSLHQNLISTFVQKDSIGIETFYDGLAKGIHFSIGADIQLWRNLKLTTAAGMGHNWIHYIDFPNPAYDYHLTTPNLQFGLTYRIPFRKEPAPEAPLQPETDPHLWLGVQLESALPVIFAVVRSPGAIYYHPYAEARITPHMRLQASAWLGPETIIAAADTSTRWGVRGMGLAARFHSQQLRRLQFFHTVGLEVVPRQYGQLYKSHIHLANGFSYDIAHRANVEAGMNLRFNSEGYYLAPFFGVAVPFTFRSKTNTIE